MHKVTIISNHQTKEVSVKSGANLLDVLSKNGYLITADCGGHGTCMKCKVKCNHEYLLACQTVVTQDIRVELPNGESDGLLNSLKRSYEIKRKYGYGIAVDLGTTTIALYLMDLKNGWVIDNISVLNAQTSYGTDVITRIKKCSEGHLDTLFSLIVKQINEIIHNFKLKHAINDIEEIVVAANTTMLHILAHTDPTSLGTAPFTPVFLKRLEISGPIINLDAKRIVLLPAISAYLGGDIVAGILACNIEEQTKNIIFIDIGTNGEIIIKTKKGIYGTSTAAGPAFEGARIEWGTGGIPGAISKEELADNELRISTINNQKAMGICGSGLVDIVSLLVSEGLIDETGTFDYRSNSNLIENLYDGRLYITDKIYISQKDIREFQLAKSAIASGIQVLLEIAELKAEDIDQIYLAGGFGFYINRNSAVNIGLLPKKTKEKIISVGNTSGLGAKMALLNDDYRTQCDEIATRVSVIELSNNPRFTEHFINNMLFE